MSYLYGDRPTPSWRSTTSSSSATRSNSVCSCCSRTSACAGTHAHPGAGTRGGGRSGALAEVAAAGRQGVRRNAAGRAGLRHRALRDGDPPFDERSGARRGDSAAHALDAESPSARRRPRRSVTAREGARDVRGQTRAAGHGGGRAPRGHGWDAVRVPRALKPAFGLEAVIDLDVPANHFYDKVIASIASLERLDVLAPEMGGWFTRR